jgi:hypothetical protein
MDNTQAQPEVQASAQPELTITDLANIRSIVDAAVRRGAFGAAELSAVGAAYDKLNSFLNSVQPQKPADDTTDAVPATE